MAHKIFQKRKTSHKFTTTTTSPTIWAEWRIENRIERRRALKNITTGALAHTHNTTQTDTKVVLEKRKINFENIIIKKKGPDIVFSVYWFSFCVQPVCHFTLWSPSLVCVSVERE